VETGVTSPPGRTSIRLGICAISAALAVLAASSARSAPTCWNAAGETVRCDVAGALPVGTALSAEQDLARRARSPDLSAQAALGLACVVGGLFALIALMPRFDGDWDGDG
jgi:hypothetical protein